MNKYEAYITTCCQCTLCSDMGLLSEDPKAMPLFMKSSPINTDILFILEAPNKDDTENSNKQYITVDKHTDPSGKFLWDLFTNELGLNIASHLFITNSVLCLPKEKYGKNLVGPLQRGFCSQWLKKLIDEFQPKIVCTLGGKAFQAANEIERNGNGKLSKVAGKSISWYNRQLFPLYHTGLLARKPPYGRSETLQREDWRELRKLYNNITA